MDWVPSFVDTSVPSIARVYDCLLGGSHNFAADRAVTDQVERVVPGIRAAARLNRAFLARAVRFMIRQGIRQFVDIGSGIPTVGNVHEIAQAADSSCRVVYVDKDPIAVAHSEFMLSDNDRAAVVEGDMRQPSSVLEHPTLRALVDFDEPIGLLFLLSLHFVPDEDDVPGFMITYRNALGPGSYLAISHGTEDMQDEKMGKIAGIIRGSPSSDQLHARTRAEITALFGDFELISPGVVPIGVWQPGGINDIAQRPEMSELMLAGVARK